MSDATKATPPVREKASGGEKCCNKKWCWGSVSTTCRTRAKVIENGQPYCGIHDPERKRKRDAAGDAKWEARRLSVEADNKRHSEERRRLARYDRASVCPICFGIENTLTRICDEPGCDRPGGCGTPTLSGGYKVHCHLHPPLEPNP